eukprot:jgi/Hompol1/3233/HPOL_006419-RA
MRQMQARIQALQSRLDTCTTEVKSYQSQLAASQSCLAETESQLKQMQVYANRAREYEATIHDLRAKVHGTVDPFSTTATATASIFSPSDEGHMMHASVKELMDDLSCRAHSLKTLQESMEAERDAFLHDRQECHRVKQLLHVKNNELARMEVVVKEQADKLQSIRQELLGRIAVQDAKYESLRKLYLVLQARFIELSCRPSE